MYLEGRLEIDEKIIRYAIVKEFSCTEEGQCDINVRGFETKTDMMKYFNLRELEEQRDKKQFAMDRIKLKIEDMNKEIEELQRIANEDKSKADKCNANIVLLREDLEELQNDPTEQEYEQLVKDCENYDREYTRFEESYFPVMKDKTPDTNITRDLMYTMLVNYVDEFKGFKIVEDKVEAPIVIVEPKQEEIIEEKKEDDTDASTNS